ncbi:hypothetical protein AJ80_00601 [Polytolypa hystricis UAMH7299]|uniref:RanBP2-type domain-containing protein n=1 Tax=Polytolypa hystricis (strain UAMH7299) TaxID=1447883 RepID=A0A2B7Z3K1_POLH7|nr:hypothetical protein AJ80_00601 [Polytolypa hystricis UAMH7299]
MAGFSIPSRTVGMPNDTWYCCECDGLNLEDNHPSHCGACQHERGDCCTTGADQEIENPARDRFHQQTAFKENQMTVSEVLSLLPRPPNAHGSQFPSCYPPATPSSFTVLHCHVEPTFHSIARPSTEGYCALILNAITVAPHKGYSTLDGLRHDLPDNDLDTHMVSKNRLAHEVCPLLASDDRQRIRQQLAVYAPDPVQQLSIHLLFFPFPFSF